MSTRKESEPTPATAEQESGQSGQTAPSAGAKSTQSTQSASTAAFDQIDPRITEALGTADAAVVAGVGNLQLVRQARLAQFKRTASVLESRFGASDPRTKSAKADVSAETVTARRLAMTQQQITTSPPDVAATGWAIHGRVFHSNLKPSAAYTVFLVDSRNAFQQDYGFAYTDNEGYFLINYPGLADAAGKLKEAKTTPTLYLQVADNKAQPVYLSTTAFQPATGSASYQNVILPAGEKPIGDPPPEIREIALPDERERSDG